MSSACGGRAGGPSGKRARRYGCGDDEATALFGHGRAGPADNGMVKVDGFDDDTWVWARVEQPGVWRELHVAYHDWEGRYGEHGAVFDDKRCGHVRKLCLSDIDEHIANKLTYLANLEELTIEPFSICYADDFDPPPPGIWPQLRRLTVGYCGIATQEIVPHQNVLPLVAAAPNLRELSVKWTRGLHCLPDILTALPLLETLRLHYLNVHDRDSMDGYADLLDCKRLDEITPRMLLSVRLHKNDCGGNKGPMASTVDLAAALVRMQHRAPHRFAIELCDKQF